MNKYSYMHYRNHNHNGEVKPQGGTTVAILEQASYVNQVIVAVSRCHSEEVFNKRIARTASTGRIHAFLEDGRETAYVITVDAGMTVKEAVNQWIQTEGRQHIRGIK